MNPFYSVRRMLPHKMPLLTITAISITVAIIFGSKNMTSRPISIAMLNNSEIQAGTPNKLTLMAQLVAEEMHFTDYYINPRCTSSTALKDCLP